MSEKTLTTGYFHAGGALGLNAPSYVQRAADKDLLKWILRGEFCYVLTARQMGKSSLMVRTVQRLRNQGISTAVIDLNEIGTNVTIEQWYLGIVVRLERHLDLEIDAEQWWSEHATLGPVQRFGDFLHDVVLVQVGGQVVIFIDEIDTTLKLEFSDDFFAAIRAIYNKRPVEPIYDRLTFVLLGVAMPADLIKERDRTPFNVGMPIVLDEFNLKDADVLQQGLAATYPEEAETIFERIYQWTNGHPYLTQQLCLAVVDDGRPSWTNEQIDGLVEQLFLSKEARKETNLQFVRDKVGHSPQRRKLLTTYRQVHNGMAIRDDERSLVHNRLKLFGLVRAENNLLRVRNEIYRRVFDLEWVKDNMPPDWTWRIVAIAVLIVVMVTSGIEFYIWQQRNRTNETLARQYETSFSATTNPALRLDALHSLFGLEGYKNRGRALFDDLPNDEKIALFVDAPSDLEGQVRGVISETYIYTRNTPEDNRVLEAMQVALERSDDMASAMLANEIARWLDGRTFAAQGNEDMARQAYSSAIDLNSQNPATHFERALLYAQVGDSSKALVDLEQTVSIHELWQERAKNTVIKDPQLYTALWHNPAAYPKLAALVAAPTDTPTSAISASTPVWASPTHSSLLTPAFPTSTHTLAPSPTPTRVPTALPSLPTLAGTPLPETTNSISAESAEQVIQLARWGNGAIQDVAYSPDGTVIAVASSIGIYIYQASTQRIERLIETDAWVTSLAFSPDGTTLAVGLRNNKVQLWQVSDGALLSTLGRHETMVNTVAFSSEGSLVASGGEDGTVRLWRIADASELWASREHVEPVWNVAFSPDGKIIASGARDTTARLWRATDGLLLQTLEGHEHWVSSVAFSPDGQTLATGGGEGAIRLWRVIDGSLKRILNGHEYSVRSLAFSPDGTMLASGSADYTVRLWDLATGNTLHTFQEPWFWVDKVTFSPAGNTLSALVDTAIWTWSIPDGALVGFISEYESAITSVDFSPDGTILVVGSWASTARLLRASDGTQYWLLRGHTDSVLNVRFSPDGRILASASADNKIGIWQASDGTLIRFLTGHEDWVWSVAFFPGGQTLTSGARDNTVRTWSIDGSLLRTFKGHTAAVTSVAVSPSGQTIASGSLDDTIRLWNAADGSLVGVLTGHTSDVTDVAFSPDGRLLASASDDQSVRVWTLPNKELAHVWTGHSTGLRSIIFTPDGTVLAAGAADGTIRLWDVQNEHLLRALHEHTDLIWDLAFSKNAKWLASASQDSTIRLWGVSPSWAQSYRPTAVQTPILPLTNR